MRRHARGRCGAEKYYEEESFMDFTKVKAALTARGYAVQCFEAAAEAAAYLNAQIDGTSVSFGGSMTVEAMGLYDSLGAHNEVVSHWHARAGESADALRRRAMGTAVYVCSANAVAETGELVNIDGSGNRLASTLYGHERVYYVVGRNKLAPTLDAAVRRAREVAAPKNAARLGAKTPCAATGVCADCRSEVRICRALLILWDAVRSCRSEVVLIDEELGY